MKKIFLIGAVISLYTGMAGALEPKLKLKMWKGNKEVFELFHEVSVSSKYFLVNEKCTLLEKTCLALKQLKRTPKQIKHPKGLTGHPASQFCEAMGGRDVILSDEKMDQYNYCSFKDETMIDSWQLYDHFFKKKKLEDK